MVTISTAWISGDYQVAWQGHCRLVPFSSSQMSCRSIRFRWSAHALLLMCRLPSAPLCPGYSDSESTAPSLPGALPFGIPSRACSLKIGNF